MTRHTPLFIQSWSEPSHPEKDPPRTGSVWCMVHSVPSFMASCSARCYHNLGIRTHPPSDYRRNPFSTSELPRSIIIWWMADIDPLLMATPCLVWGAASGRVFVKLEAEQEKKDLLPVPCPSPPSQTRQPPSPLVRRPRTSLPSTNFGPKALRFHLDFDMNLNS